MLLLRRAVALAVLLAALYVAGWAQSSHLGIGRVVYLVVAIPVALCALVILASSLPIAKIRAQESGFEHSVLSEGQGRVFGAIIVSLFGIAMVFLAVRGLFTGGLSAPWSDVEIEFRHTPFRYLIAMSFWLGLGGIFLWLASRVFRLPHATPKAPKR